MPETKTTDTAEKPKHLSNPRRAFVKKTGKKLMRKVAAHQSKASLVPNSPLVDPAHFDFLKPISDNWETIRDEALEVLKFREQIPGFQEISPDQYKIATGKNWRTFVLFGFGERLEKNAQVAPKTADLIGAVPNVQTAMFSILAPGYHIPAHTGVTKGILRVHLGLIIPKEHEKCRIRVGDTITAWKPGEMFIIDDTYEHEVWNDTDEERVVLLLDFDRPMKWSGRFLNKALLTAMKFTAFYQDPKKNLEDAEARLEAAIHQNNENMESMSD